MTQQWSPPGHHRYGIRCGHCQAVASYTFSSGQAEAVQAMGGRLSHTQTFYCPQCALQRCRAKMSGEAVDHYMSRCWVRANDLWHLAGMALPPPTTCSELARKIKHELVADTTSNFAIAVWDRLDPLEQLQFSDPPLPRLGHSTCSASLSRHLPRETLPTATARWQICWRRCTTLT